MIIRNVSWETYERLTEDLKNQSSPRLAYDRGVLEIMSPHFEHEGAKEILAYIVAIALESMEIDFVSAGSTTYKRELLKRGFEPDASFFIKTAKQVRDKKKLDMEVDPPPEVIIEIDVTSDSMDKFSLYAALKVAEVWRYSDAIEIWLLHEGGYVRNSNSLAIPVLNEELLSELMESSLQVERPVWARQTRERIRQLL